MGLEIRQNIFLANNKWIDQSINMPEYKLRELPEIVLFSRDG